VLGVQQLVLLSECEEVSKEVIASLSWLRYAPKEKAVAEALNTLARSQTISAVAALTTGT
jgi:hypothetical protein